MRKPQIFISHAADEDKKWLRRFAAALQELGANVWLDEFELQAGEPVREPLEKALRGSDIIVSVVSQESLKRPNFYFEIGAAVGMGKRVVPILLKGVEPSQLPQPLRSRRFLFQQAPQETAKELLAAEEPRETA